MTININDKFRLTTIDSNNVALQKLGKNDNGEDRWDNISYYARLSVALRDIVDSSVFVHEMKNLADLKKHLDRIDEIKAEFTAAFNK